mmetsp:Transcript_117861/g.184173  ORF Transcript_117861/g.184173 Transcript_117861/m.184173 type:complete len:199 (-) Transcript_117861:1362-1958(-)
MLRASFVVLSVLASAVRGNVICHSIDPRASDDWCNKNCNCKPIPNCPASWCKCEDGPTPGPTPPPGPPSPPSPPSPPPSVKNSVFELDLFVNDPSKGWQADGFPQYLQESAAKYMNVAGISFIQPSNLMDNTYDLPDKVGNAVQVLSASSKEAGGCCSASSGRRNLLRLEPVAGKSRESSSECDRLDEKIRLRNRGRQ